MRLRGHVATRFFDLDGAPVLATAWQRSRDRIQLQVEALSVHERDPATAEELEQAADRMRFALAVDDDLSDFYRRFRQDRLLGRIIHLKPFLRPIRVTKPWDALAWAIAGQLIEGRRAALIARRIVRRWGSAGPDGLSDTPSPEAIADRAPAELEACDLSARRAIAMRTAAREVVAGRIDLDGDQADSRLLAIPQIGPWTVQCLGLLGRGDHDSLPAGDLDYLKLVGRLKGLGRRAEIDEVEEFFEPYRPYRGLAGEWMRQAARPLLR